MKLVLHTPKEKGKRGNVKFQHFSEKENLFFNVYCHDFVLSHRYYIKIKHLICHFILRHCQLL